MSDCSLILLGSGTQKDPRPGGLFLPKPHISLITSWADSFVLGLPCSTYFVTLGKSFTHSGPKLSLP
jgi:hypothetical protein